MEKRTILGYIIIVLTLIFIISYVIDGINEQWYPPFGVFAYKTPLLYWLKLIYACIFLFSGVDLLMKRGQTWYLMMFSSVGMLTSSFFIYINGYIFRTAILDQLLFLEIISVVLMILYNVKRTVVKYEIFMPRNRCMLIGLFMIINIVLNYCALLPILKFELISIVYDSVY